MSRGKPTIYRDEIAMHITTELVEGRSLRSICRDDEGMPRVGSVMRWLANPEYATFREQYACAREAQADMLAEEIVDISNETVMGEETTTKPDGSVEVRAGDMLGHRKLQIDARKWYASKLAPKKYGDKLGIGGSDDLPPIQLNAMSNTERAVRIAALLAAAKKRKPA